jgi:solute:Na+ symporter, SSS family
MIATYICLILFVIVMISLGYIGMRRTKNVNDFFLAGRNLGPWLSAFSYGATYFSAVLFVGFAGKLGWLFGTNVLWIAFGNVFVGVFLAWFVLAKRTRRMTVHLKVMTMPEFLEARYLSPMLKPFAACIIFIFLIPYSASVYQGLAYLFEANLKVSFSISLFFIALLTGIYLVMGGYHAINIADLIQGTIMIGGALLMVFFLVNSIGGFSEATKLQNEKYWEHFAKPGVEQQLDVKKAEILKAAGENESVIPAPVKKKKGPPPWWILVSLVILTSVGPWGLPQMVQKYYAIKSEKIIPKIIVVTTLFAIIIAFSAYYCGSLTHVFFNPGNDAVVETSKGAITATALPMTEGAKPAPEFDKFIPIMLQKHTPGWLNTAILLLILSASMSTLSGLVLVASSAIAIDLYRGRNPTEERKKNSLLFMRILCIFFIIASVVLALYRIAVIVSLMSIAWGAVAGCFLAPYVYGLFWKKGTKTAVWVSMIIALIITVGGFIIFGKALSPVYGSFAMIVPLIIFPIVSMCSSSLPEKHLNHVFNSEKI